MSLNVVSISGNLGADAELRVTRSGAPVITFAVAVNERVPAPGGGYEERTSWIDCAMFGKRAEALAPILRRGLKVAVTGRLHARTWEQDGQARKSVEVRVDDVELMTVRRERQREAADPADVWGGC